MKNFLKKNIIFVSFALIALLLIVIAFTIDFTFAFVCLVVLLAFSSATIINEKAINNKLQKKANDFSALFDVSKGNPFETLKIACCAIEEDGKIVWFNKTFANNFEVDNSTPNRSIQTLFGKKDDFVKTLIKGNGRVFKIIKQTDSKQKSSKQADNTLFYSVNSSLISENENKLFLLYLFNETKIFETERKLRESAPIVMHVVIDNTEEIYDKFKESESPTIFSKINLMIENWASSFGAVTRKYSNSRIFVVLNESAYAKMVNDKFSILERVRNFNYDNVSINITLSIGVGRRGTLEQISDFARDALDMAQSRGGDRVVVKSDETYSFFGGVTENKDTKSKVRARYNAKLIANYIKSSSNIVAVGHRFSDFDSFGACVGIAAAARHFGKDCKIICDKESSLATPLINKFEQKISSDIIISPTRAPQYIREKTLVFLCDTHSKNLSDCPEIFDLTSNVIIIDHHRKGTDTPPSNLLMCHRANASSACEMTSEYLRYMDSKKFIDGFTARALLSGITLDTRNYVIRCNVRTFEACAFLKDCNASTVEVKKLFSNDIDLFRFRNQIVDNAFTFNDVAISVADFDNKSIRLITSRAADEMLNFEGVKASFVIYKNGDGANISARSYGEINVQKIMEKLGGGGHLAMSACRLKETTTDEALEKLKSEILKYIKNNS